MGQGPPLVNVLMGLHRVPEAQIRKIVLFKETERAGRVCFGASSLANAIERVSGAAGAPGS